MPICQSCSESLESVIYYENVVDTLEMTLLDGGESQDEVVDKDYTGEWDGYYCPHCKAKLAGSLAEVNMLFYGKEDPGEQDKLKEE